jgi:hypothetical protein
MSKPLTVTNTFASQAGPIPLSQLDADIAQLALAINDVPTYGNYYSDIGAVNALAVTVPAPLTFTYATGAWLDVLVANNNTSTVTLNVNALGAKAVVDMSGVALTAGMLLGGGIFRLVYDGTSFRVASVVLLSGSFTCGWVGFSANPSTTVLFTRVGKQVTLTWAPTSGTSSTTSLQMTGLPTYLIPSTSKSIPAVGWIDNAVDAGVVFVSLTGAGSTITFNKGAISGNWTAASTKGPSFGSSITYDMS